MVYTYYGVGRYIVEYKQSGNFRASYGKGVLNRLSSKLTDKFGKGWSYETLAKCRKFYNVYAILSAPQTESIEPHNLSTGQTKSHIAETLSDTQNDSMPPQFTSNLPMSSRVLPHWNFLGLILIAPTVKASWKAQLSVNYRHFYWKWVKASSLRLAKNVFLSTSTTFMLTLSFTTVCFNAMY